VIDERADTRCRDCDVSWPIAVLARRGLDRCPGCGGRLIDVQPVGPWRPCEARERMIVVPADAPLGTSCPGRNGSA
jgi:hypothetical protein